QAVDFVLQGVPDHPPPPPAVPSSAGARGAHARAGDRGGDEGPTWSDYFARPGLLRALRVLAGLCRGHGGAQGLLMERGLLQKLHWMEGTSVSGEVGLLAETLLEAAVHDNEVTGEEVKRLRNETRTAKRKLAQARRERALKSMRVGTSLSGTGIPAPGPGNEVVAAAAAKVGGEAASGGATDASMPQASRDAGQDFGRSSSSSSSKRDSTGSGSVASSTPPWMSEMMGLEEETGLTCMVCHEGYKCKPKNILGVYVHARALPGQDLHEGEGDFLLSASQLGDARTDQGGRGSGSGGGERSF
ncbi:unnamed protein product, partial [Discosporangium mesarthrocarpum]